MIIYIVFGIIAALCLVQLGRIVVPKLPQIAMVDTSLIPEVREAEKKKEIVRGKLHRNLTDAVRVTGGLLAPIGDKVQEAFRGHYRALLDIDKQFKKEQPMEPARLRAKVGTLIAEGASLAGEGRSDDAEKKFIEALALDPRRLEAYRGLADIYVEKKRFDRAKETLAYLAKALIRENRCIHGTGIRSFASEENEGACPATPAAHADIAGRWVALAAVCESLADADGATDAYERAVAVEPSNPRNLDLLLEACILGGDKRRAEEVLEQLGTVNPENGKIEGFAERMQEMAMTPDVKKRSKKG